MDEARVKQYFERIGLVMPEKIVPDAQLLETLTFHNIISIPYENTQFLTKKITPCDPDALFQRIVVEKKGGICHDVNGLFGWFLGELGYKVVSVGTVSFLDKIKTHVHKTLVVTDIDGNEWLTEAAYASLFSNKNPIRFIPGLMQTFGDETFHIEKIDGKFCLIGPTDKASFRMEYWDMPPVISTRVKELTLEHGDPAGNIRRNLAIGTPEGYRALAGTSYREAFGSEIYSYNCTPEMLPWAYAQFGLRYEEDEENIV